MAPKDTKRINQAIEINKSVVRLKWKGSISRTNIKKNKAAKIACKLFPPSISIFSKYFFWIIVAKEIATNATKQLKKPINGSSPPILGQTTKITPINPIKIPIHLSKVIFSSIINTASMHVKTGCNETIKDEIPAEVPCLIEKNTPPKYKPCKSIPTKAIYGISIHFGHLALKIKTNEAKIHETIANLTVSMLNGPASSNPNFAATNALAHKKTNVIFRIKSIKIFKPLIRQLKLSFLLNLTFHSFKV